MKNTELMKIIYKKNIKLNKKKIGHKNEEYSSKVRNTVYLFYLEN